jgi:hypothetical protein
MGLGGERKTGFYPILVSRKSSEELLLTTSVAPFAFSALPKFCCARQLALSSDQHRHPPFKPLAVPQGVYVPAYNRSAIKM